MMDSSVVENALRAGDKEYEAGHYDAAISEYSRATLLDPSDATAFFKCGKTFFAQDNFEDARNNYVKAAHLDTNMAEANFGLGLALAKLGDHASAVNAFEAATVTDQTFAEAYYELGDALYNSGNHQKAARKYEKVISLQGPAAEVLRGKAFHSLGVTLILDGKDEEGLEKFKSAHDAGLRDPLLFHNMGATLRRLGRTDEAIAKYKEAIERDDQGKLSATHNNLGMIYDSLYKDEAAIEEFKLATREGSDHAAKAFNNWGNVLLRLRKYSEALEKYHQSIKLDADYAKAYYNKAYTLWQQGKHKESRRAWKEALAVFIRKQTDAKDTEHFRLCGNIHHEVFQAEVQAEKAYLEALTRSSGNLEAMLNLITLYAQQRDSARDVVERNDAQVKVDQYFRKAMRILKRRLQETLDGRMDVFELHLLKGNLYQAVGKYAEAESSYQEALKDLQGSGKTIALQAVYSGLGNSCIQQDECKKGAEYLERALQENPDDLSVKSQLAEAYCKLDHTDKAERKYEEIFNISMSVVESYIGRGELCKTMGDRGETDMYDYAISFFTDALNLSRSKEGSKVLKDKEIAALLYSRGYASVKLYEQTKPARDENLLRAALSDFRISYQKDKCNIKAKRACEKLTLRLSYTRSQNILRSIGPPIIFAVSAFLFFITQYLFFRGKPVFWDESTKTFQGISETHYVLLTFGSLIFMIAGLSLPELLKIKIAGVELEKSTIAQTQPFSSLGISK